MDCFLFKVKRAKLPTHVLLIHVQMVASALPLIPPTSAPAHPPSMARPASKMSTSAHRPPPLASMAAFVSTRWARTTADALRSTLANTVRHHTCHAAPLHAKMEAPVFRRETPPTTAPVFQVTYGYHHMADAATGNADYLVPPLVQQKCSLLL